MIAQFMALALLGITAPFSSSGAAAAAANKASVEASAKPAEPDSGEEAHWTFKRSIGDWGIICSQSNSAECRAIQNVTYSSEGSTKGRLLQLVFSNANNRPVLFAKFPLGVDLRAGTALQIGAAPELQAAYVTCMPDGCQSFFPLTPAHLAEMQKIKAMKIGFRPIALGNKTVVLESSLEKFGEVLAGLKQ